jgi:peptide/nickel transport system ATP-binding protein
VLILERGSVCEEGTVAKLLISPSHPYTRRLVEAAPRLETRPTPGASGESERLI